ncbi:MULTISPECIES: hypothetical protein [unclassified Campylobacter]|uniref:hypothetical protein n=1 Tax=unclassified Campylobacter TaxID=2593542 RepID=UPI001DE64376|nr:hypothetical protein [Campylobacter sp. RM12651]MBZ7984324.1 hypothetical protein [Campylobacter sp. RM12647]MBZ7993563.1 hypothetical protein [Campylobacter sp. RM9333]ULO02617.1 hypothetical protein AVBRAN_0129 [Campylobacter sp. RM12651]
MKELFIKYFDENLTEEGTKKTYNNRVNYILSKSNLDFNYSQFCDKYSIILEQYIQCYNNKKLDLKGNTKSVLNYLVAIVDISCMYLNDNKKYILDAFLNNSISSNEKKIFFNYIEEKREYYSSEYRTVANKNLIKPRKERTDSMSNVNKTKTSSLELVEIFKDLNTKMAVMKEIKLSDSFGDRLMESKYIEAIIEMCNEIKKIADNKLKNIK